MKNHELLQEEVCLWFCIAGHFMKVAAPAMFDWEGLLPSFRPFRVVTRCREEAVICTVRITDHSLFALHDQMKMLNETSGMLGFECRLMETGSEYIIDIRYVQKGSLHRMVADKSFTVVTLYLDGKDPFVGNVASSFLMIAFEQTALLHQTILIHSSVVEQDGNGYAFMGKSGTGKSTHSALWIRYLEGVRLLNDDNPLIRMKDDGNVWIYGSPWSGKTTCYINRGVPLKALVRLEQAPINEFTWKEGTDALIALLPGCSAIRWNNRLYNTMCDLLEKVIDTVRVGYLKCRPDREAVLICAGELGKVFDKQ